MNNKNIAKSLVAFVFICMVLIPSLSIFAQDSEPGSPLADQAWVRLGGPLGGLGYDIRMRPDNPDIMYVTDAWAGVHMSVDSGRTWYSVNDGIDARSGPSGDAVPVFCLTIDPNNFDILWIGTQSFRGVYRSTDAGQTWEKRTNGIVEGTELTVRGVAIEPGNSEVVYVAAEISQNNWGREFDRVKGVIYKSTDAGLNWRAIWRGDSLARYVLIDPTDIYTIYISTGIFDREAANSNPQTNTPGGEGVLKSTDGGDTWTAINEGIRNLYIGSLFMHPENPQILIAGAGNNAYFPGGGIYLTVNGGAHWQHVGGEHIQSVEFSVGNPNVVYAGGEGEFLRSDDGGHTWHHYVHARGWGWGPDGIRPGFPIDFQVDPRDPMRVFVNNYGGGNFLSDDGGKTWISASVGYTGADLVDISIHPDDPAVVYTNGRSGPFVSTDGGITWKGINPIEISGIAEGARVSIDPSYPDHVLVSSAHWGWTYGSIDGGNSWRLNTDYNQALQNLPLENTNLKFQGMQAVSFAPSDTSIVYGGFGIWRCATDADPEMCHTPPLFSIMTSHNGGRDWEESQGLTGFTVTEIVVHPQDANIAWAATAAGGVFMTTDGGKTWELRSDGLLSMYIMSLAVDPSNPMTLYAGTSERGLFVSNDGGQTWVSSSLGMDPNEPVGAIVIDPTHPNVIYAGSWRSGVYLSEDGGARWRLHNEGLRTRSVRSLAISSDGQTLYAATRGEGVFRLSTFIQEYFE